MRRSVHEALAAGVAVAGVLVGAPPASAATGQWTIDLACLDDGGGPEEHVVVQFGFGGLPSNASGWVTGRHDYGGGPNDHFQTSTSVTTDATGNVGHSYQVRVSTFSHWYQPKVGDEFAWTLHVDGLQSDVVGTTPLGGAGCAEAVITPGTPTISGQAKVGRTLTSATGTWTPTGIAFARQWYADGAAIAGATGTSLTVKPALVGRRISVKVTGSKAGHASVARTSAKTAAVTKGTLAPAPKPKIGGTAKVGKTLTAKAGAWGPGTVATSYRWYANGTAIKGAKGRKLKVKSAHVGKRIRVKVTGSKPGYAKVVRTSSATKKVRR